MTDEPADLSGLVRVANLRGFWLREAHSEQVRGEMGGRYWVSREGSTFPQYASDSLENVRGWLHIQE